MPPEMNGATEMARTKAAPGNAPSAAHAATDPAPAPRSCATAADSPAAAVYAALEANPGSTVAVIADAAGTGKPAARAALLEMEKVGTAARVKGDRPGIPDTWTLAGPAPDGTSPAAAPEAGQAYGQPGDRTPPTAPTVPPKTRRARSVPGRPHRRERRPGARGRPRRRGRCPRRARPGDGGARVRTTPPPEPATRTRSRTSRTPRRGRAATRTAATPRTARTPRRTAGGGGPGDEPDPALVHRTARPSVLTRSDQAAAARQARLVLSPRARGH